MRKLTPHYVYSLRSERLSPFPGKWPTRIMLRATRQERGLPAEAQRELSHYVGKPSERVWRHYEKLAQQPNIHVDFVEFDRLGYTHRYVMQREGSILLARNAQKWRVYHPVVPMHHRWPAGDFTLARTPVAFPFYASLPHIVMQWGPDPDRALKQAAAYVDAERMGLDF